MNHTAGRVAIISASLRSRAADVQAVVGLSATPFARLWPTAVATTPGDPREAAAGALAQAKALPLIVFSPGPIALTVLERSGRPLSYRLSGLESRHAPAADRAATDAELQQSLDNLLTRAHPDEITVDPDFDPADSDVFWLDPFTRRLITVDEALVIAGDILRAREKTARRSFVFGVSRWKRGVVASFLDGAGGPVAFPRLPARGAAVARESGARLVVWASRNHRAARRAGEESGVPVAKLEDGFLRSVGLGSAFVAPASLVLDRQGIYYDPSEASELETLLRESQIDAPLAQRAAALRRRLVAEGATKYNVGAAAAAVVPPGRFGLLVPGQVEDDASIRRGAGAVRTNLALLAAARARRPDAFIVYKPHPDVVAGYRAGRVLEPEISRLADAVVIEGSIAPLYDQCAAIETMTSLAGFEGLLRGLAVTTHGQPFYAGWGLTEDLAPPLKRRGRSRSLDELVACALILYPLYRDARSGLPCGPETVLDRLLEQRLRAAGGAGRLAARLRHAYALTRHRLLGPIARRLP